MSDMQETKMRHTLSALVENKPGVLNRVVSLFRKRGFNIDSLTVGRTQKPEISRMTIVMEGTALEAVKYERNLYKLVNVISVDHLTEKPAVSRDLALVKVAVNDETRAEVTEICAGSPARIVDVAPNSVIVEIASTQDKVEALVEMLRPFGIIEMVRTGVVAMGRGEEPLTTHGYEPATVGYGNGYKKNAY